jgi:allantoinase
MPLNSIPPTTTASGLQAKLAAAAGKLWVDVGFWGGVVPGNAAEMRPLWDAGVYGFKCFLVPSGVEEFPAVKRSDLREALPELVSLGAVLLVHSELPEPIEKASEAAGSAKPERYATWLASRPSEAETEAIALLVRLSRELGARIHIVHLSSAEGAALVREAKAKGLSVTAETCPHYLTFSAEEISNGATEFKCAPAVREHEHREALWDALREGTIDCVVTDHSPCPPEMKLRETGDFLKAWGGIASLQVSLAAVWTEAQRRGHSVRELAAWMCEGPARLAGLEKRKGAIAVGYDADLVVWEPEASFVVEAARLHHRHKLTPYDGRELTGVVEATFLRGRKIYERGEFCGAAIGAPLLRGKN